MFEIICENCKKKWYVLEEDWTEVKVCPFCDVEITTSYNIEINSFESALKYVLLNQGIELLRKKRILVSFLKDFGNKYNQEIRIFSNFCSEEMLCRFYDNRKDIALLEKESLIAKLEMKDNGISEQWAETIIENVIKVIKEIQHPETSVPANFHRIDEKANISENNQEIDNKSTLSVRQKDLWKIVIDDKPVSGDLCKEIFAYAITLLCVDKEKAMKCIRFSSKYGCAEADILLGECFENGDGVEKDWRTAEIYYRRAAGVGNHEAEYRLGVLLHKNGGWLAEHWLQKAAGAGHFGALSYLKNIKKEI